MVSTDLPLHPGRSSVQQGEEVLEQGELLGQVLSAHVGAAERQHHGEQLEAVGVGGGVLVAGLRVGVLLAGDGVLPLLTDTRGLHAYGLHDVGTHLHKQQPDTTASETPSKRKTLWFRYLRKHG